MRKVVDDMRGASGRGGLGMVRVAMLGMGIYGASTRGLGDYSFQETFRMNYHGAILREAMKEAIEEGEQSWSRNRLLSRKLSIEKYAFYEKLLDFEAFKITF